MKQNPNTTDYVTCPICGEPDMEKISDGGDEYGALIRCINIACVSNGGPNSDMLDRSRGRTKKDEKTYRVVLALYGEDGSAKLTHHDVSRENLLADDKLKPLLKLYESIVQNKKSE